MNMPAIKWFRLLLALLAAAALCGIGLLRLEIDTDVIGSLPRHDPVVSGAIGLFKNHPIQDQVFIDVTLEGGSRDELVQCGQSVENRLLDSGLFKRVGLADVQQRLPDLVFAVLQNLPVLFTEKELQEQVAPRLEKKAIDERMGEIRRGLLNMEGIVQARFVARDPLGLKNMVMARMAGLLPSKEVQIYQNKILSADGRHLLLMANPKRPGTDTASARELSRLLADIQKEMERKYERVGRAVLTPMGAYRAALDNEEIIRKDVELALTLATVGIAILLLIAFPRPFIGLLSLVPAAVGAMVGCFVYSLVNHSISIMVLGFGGAVISITVDHGIAYLLFVDRTCPTRGREAAREVWSVGLLAVLTTVGAFGALSLSDFPIFEQLGQFTALGIFFSFVFVHTVFPLIFPSLPAAGKRRLPLRKLVNWMCSGGKTGAAAAALFCLCMLFFAKPVFDVSMESMNTVRPETRSAEKQMASVWGSIFEGRNVFLMVEAESLPALQQKGDRLLSAVEKETSNGILSAAFLPSMVFPGPERAASNFAAWQNFWSGGRTANLKETLSIAAEHAGFTKDAFTPFYALIAAKSQPDGLEIAPELYEMLGIFHNEKSGKWFQFASLQKAERYEPASFFHRHEREVFVFDPSFFPVRLGQLLSETFLKMFFIIGASVVALLLLLFLDLRVTLIALLPVFFALVCTLGTLHLIGHPLDIPALMLSIVILGMGIDYSLFFVRAYQRYAGNVHPSYELIRMAVFMAAASTLVGFGALCLAEHSILRSVGLMSLLGIGYSLIGAFAILPPLLAHHFKRSGRADDLPGDLHAKVRRRYALLEAHPRMFARLKLRTDPMFSELPKLLEPLGAVKTIVDIGTGYGIPASWFLAKYPQSRVYGLDPDPERVRVASIAIEGRGRIEVGAAPAVPSLPEPADVAMMLDMTHYIDDQGFALLLQRLRRGLRPGGALVLRAVPPPEKRFPVLWWLDRLRFRLKRIPCHFRTVEEVREHIRMAGFEIAKAAPSGSGGGLYWLVGLSKT